MNPESVQTKTYTHPFNNGALVSVRISGTWSKLISAETDWHGYLPNPEGDEHKAFWDEFEAFYGLALHEAQSFISPEAIHSDEGLAILFPDRVYSLKMNRPEN